MERQTLIKVVRSAFLFFLIIAVFVISPSWLMIVFLLLFADLIFIKRSFKHLVARLRPAIFLGSVILLIYVFASDLYSGLSLALRFLVVFWLAQIIMEEVPVQRFISIMGKWKFLNFPFERLSLMLLVATISFPLIYRESRNIYQAHVSRGLDFRKGGIREKVKMLLFFLNAFFLKIFDRVEALSLALQSRMPNLA